MTALDNIQGNKNPYMIGPNTEGHSETLHYRFIDNYRKGAISIYSYGDYQKAVAWDPERREEVDNIVAGEELSIQLEMLIYLKIWEADMMLKRFYQLTRLVHKQPYDWHFAIQESSRDKDATGNRDTIIRKFIRERLKEDYPEIYQAIKNSFLTQIRNSIAHSNYSMHGRNIHLNN